jgi:nucleotide-binding universal stress UspA family protein
MGIIVVGVDGSGNSRGALDWALNEARLRGSSVRALHAWMIPVVGTGEAPWALAPPPSYVELSAKEIEQHAREALDREVEEALARVGVVIDIERVVVEDSAGDAVIDASADAELIVVGSRGRGALATLVLGSVSHHVVQHAGCPVVVVPAPAA